MKKHKLIFIIFLLVLLSGCSTQSGEFKYLSELEEEVYKNEKEIINQLANDFLFKIEDEPKEIKPLITDEVTIIYDINLTYLFKNVEETLMYENIDEFMDGGNRGENVDLLDSNFPKRKIKINNDKAKFQSKFYYKGYYVENKRMAEIIGDSKLKLKKENNTWKIYYFKIYFYDFRFVN